jgi:hypothetical protein
MGEPFGDFSVLYFLTAVGLYRLLEKGSPVLGGPALYASAWMRSQVGNRTWRLVAA